MKKNLSKVIVPTIAISIGAALAGSISGTVAWYQYSTRANVAYIGSSVGLSENLYIRIKGQQKWVTNLIPEDVATWLATNKRAQKVQPLTPGSMDKDAALATFGGTGANKDKPKFYKNPIAGAEEYSSWLTADENNYFSLPLELCFVKNDGTKQDINSKKVDEMFLARDVYLSDLLIQGDYSNTANNNNRLDLSDAIRVHIESYQLDDNNQKTSVINRLISKKGGTTITHGQLDIDGDGQPDKKWNGTGTGAQYGFGPNNEQVIIDYGKNTGENAPESMQSAYHADKDIIDKADASYYNAEDVKTTPELANILPSTVETTANTLELTKLTYKDGESARKSKKIGTTVAYDPSSTDPQKFLNVNLTIWVEGWQKFQVIDEEGNPKVDSQDNPVVSSIWDAGYIGSKFDVGFQFAVQAGDSNHTEAIEAAND